MGHFLLEECCPECGHILPNSRTICTFFKWSALEPQTEPPMDQMYTMDELFMDGDFSYAHAPHELTGAQAIM